MQVQHMILSQSQKTVRSSKLYYVQSHIQKMYIQLQYKDRVHLADLIHTDDD